MIRQVWFDQAGGKIIGWAAGRDKPAWIEPDEDQLAEELPKLRNRVAALKRVGFLEAWRDDLVAQADIKEYHQF